MSFRILAIQFFPETASTSAEAVDRLFFILLGFGAFFIVTLSVTALVFLVRYRRGKKRNRSTEGFPTAQIETTWIVIPLILVLGLFWWGARAYVEIKNPPEEALQIYVVAKQWMWKIQHPTGHREINELHVPIGSPVELIMISQDVIHSFFVPVFRVKADVLPGRYTSVWFHPTKAGTYHLFCAEYCGTKHSQMTGKIVVMEVDEYEKWLGSRTEKHDPMVVAGQALFRARGCTGCHTPGSAVRAPSLDGLFGRPVPLEGGGTVNADERYIRDSILLPMSQVVAGYDPVMPSFEGLLSEEELMELIAYIKSLGAANRTKIGEIE